MAEHITRISRFTGPAIATLLTVALIALAGINAGKTGSLAAAAASSNTEGALFFIVPSQQRLIAADINSGAFKASFDLEQTPAQVVPTPGGVSVFVSYENSGILDVFSAETFEFQRRNDTGLDSIDDFVFSPDGSRIYIRSGDGENAILTQFSHRLLEMTNPRTLKSFLSDSYFIPNRRGTYFYQAHDSQLASYYAQSMDLVEENIAPITNPVFTADYSKIWGRQVDGSVLALDPEKPDGRKVFNLEAAEIRPAASDAIWFVAHERSSVLKLPPNGRGRAETIELSGQADFILRAGETGAWAVSSQGDLWMLRDNTVINSSTLPTLEGPITQAAAAIIKRDGSFACF